MRASSFLLTVFFLVTLGYAVPAYAPPKCDGVDDPPACNKGDGGTGGNVPQVIGVHEHANVSKSAPLWHPTDTPDAVTRDLCLMTKSSGSSLNGAFPRHDLCATLTTDMDLFISDDIVIVVNAHRGVVQDVQVQGQDVIGFEGLVHISDVVTVDSVDRDADGNVAVIHVHADHVNLHRCDTHVLKQKSVCDFLAGEFSMHDLVYSVDDP